MANRSIKSERINAMTGWPIGKVGFLRNILKFAVFLALLAPLAGHASNAEYLKIYLMQPKEIILQKINGVDGLDRYIKEVETTINQKIAKSVLAQSWGFLVIAVRHDGKIKAWVDTDEEISPEIASAMIAVATHNKGFEVKEGVPTPKQDAKAIVAYLQWLGHTMVDQSGETGDYETSALPSKN